MLVFVVKLAWIAVELESVVDLLVLVFVATVVRLLADLRADYGKQMYLDCLTK